MDMSMPFDSAIAYLSITDPKCIQAAEGCIAFYAAENASQAALPWTSLFLYGHWTTCYYIFIVGILFLVQIYQYRKDRIALAVKTSVDAIPQRSTPSLLDKLQAAGRAIFYRRLPTKVNSWIDAPSDIGTMSFLIFTVVFLAGLAFGARPYYREHLGYGSPPLSIRAGLMSTACGPILIALGGKVNIITILTGISHERLNVWHRWVAWMAFGLALLHSIPFFVASFNDWGNGGYARVKKEFYGHGMDGADEFSGVPPLAILFALCTLSVPQLRRRFYESFFVVHILLVITFSGVLFWHLDNKLDSWHYHGAALALWISSWLARVFWKIQPLSPSKKFLVGAPATLTILPGSVTRIEVWPQDNLEWKPGQHFFLRFTDIAPLENHPFTIASVPTIETSEPNRLVFLVRSHSGVTHKLASYAKARMEETSVSTAATVWIEGPYGGIRRNPHCRYDTLILFAGGTGIAACMPWVLDSISKAKASSTRLRRVVLVWAAKNHENFAWMKTEFERYVKDFSAPPEVFIRFYVTAHQGSLTTELSEKTKDEPEKTKEGGSSGTPSEAWLMGLGGLILGRPVISDILKEFVQKNGRTMVIGCGPDGFRTDIGNAVAAAQKQILRGECIEIGMHLEIFGL